MTEDEAKTRWCPFARTPGFATGAAVNRPFPGNDGDVVPSDCGCIASACMAWRPTGEHMFKDASTGKLWRNDISGNGKWVWTEGFCGLAGIPQ